MKRVASLDSKKSGFTLLELLIVLAILIVIIGILGTTVWNSYKRALIRAAEVKIKTLTQAVEEFKMDQRGEYPTLVEGLYILANVDNPDAAAAMQQAQMQQQTMGMAGQNMNNMNGQMNTGMMNDPTMMGGQAGMMNDPTMMGGQAGMMNDPTMMGGQTGMMNDPNMMNGGMGQMNGQMNMTGMQNGAMQQNATVNPMKPKRKIPEPYIKETDLEDPWNNPFKYEWPTTKGDGKKPAIWSMGPDGEDNNGDGDDIINWDATDMSGQMNAQRNAQAAGLQNGMMQQNGMMNNGMMQQNGMMQGGMDMTGGMQGGMDMTGGMQGGMDMTGGMQGGMDMTGGMQQGGMPQGGQQQPMF
ncbi:MAG: type II secretion system protein GspG [Thermoguttaceae bacterium]|nr:type II secretion system protein GspG [Thermoguttaceae bacterium]